VNVTTPTDSELDDVEDPNVLAKCTSPFRMGCIDNLYDLLDAAVERRVASIPFNNHNTRLGILFSGKGVSLTGI
jgi:hypothetical protein